MGDDDTHGPERQRLWFSLDRSRRFLVPEQVSLAKGGYPIRDPAGHQRTVDPVQLGAFEVSAAATDAWAKAELGRVLGSLGGNLRRSFASVPPPTDAPPEAPVTPGLDLLAAITGTPRADLDPGGGAVVEALRRYASDLGGTVAGAVSGDAARIATAQARMAEWGATLREHGTEVAAPGLAAGPPPAPGEAPTAEAPAPEQSPAAEGASGFAARLHALAEDFRRRADALAAAREGGASTPTGEATDAPRPAAPNPNAAAALEALAQGLEDSATDAVARLRHTAARLRQSRNDEADGTPPRAEGDTA
jgi:hypothetical protein